MSRVEGHKVFAYRDTDGIPTISIGINLRVHGDLVLEMLGFDVSGQLLTGEARVAEDEYIQRMKVAFTGTYADDEAVQRALEPILTNRYNDSRYDSSYERITEFEFATEADSLSAFDAMMAGYPGFAGYEAQLDGWFVAQGIPPLGESKERIALVSLAFNNGGALLGPKLAAALKSGDRAEAWYEIRYRSNADGVNANRRYKESDLFGLYDENATAEDHKAAYRMYTRHRDSNIYGYGGILGYEGHFNPANAVYDAEDRPSADIKTEFAPATEYLIRNYSKGVAIAWDHIFVGEDASTVYFRGTDTDAGQYALTGTAENDLMSANRVMTRSMAARARMSSTAAPVTTLSLAVSVKTSCSVATARTLFMAAMKTPRTITPKTFYRAVSAMTLITLAMAISSKTAMVKALSTGMVYSSAVACASRARLPKGRWFSNKKTATSSMNRMAGSCGSTTSTVQSLRSSPSGRGKWRYRLAP